MKETGIIMSGDHPVKCRDGTKTLTRRLWGLKEINKSPEEWCISGHVGAEWGFGNLYGEDDLIIKCPYGQVGDNLWVRETWAELGWHENAEDIIHSIRDDKGGLRDIIYFEECPDFKWLDDDGGSAFRKDGFPKSCWKPSIFMPRWASRITLEITEIKVERLQEITEEDALAEGIIISQGTWQRIERDADTQRLKLVGEPQPYTARYHFEALWDSLNAKRGYGWEVNPWVWVVSFKLAPTVV